MGLNGTGYTFKMRLSQERIKALQKLLKEHFGLDYTDEEAQQAGLAIMRFVVAKEMRSQELQKKSTDNKPKS